jgi:hypothetical protein
VKRSTLFMAASAAAPLLALSVGAPTAAATPPSASGASVSIDGSPKVTSTGSTAVSYPSSEGRGTHNIAIAVNGGDATALGGGNRAIAINGRSYAIVSGGATSSGLAVNGGKVQVYESSGSSAKALNGAKTGKPSYTLIQFADDSTATAINFLSYAEAYGGTNLTARATCGGVAFAHSGNPTDTSHGDYCGG